MAADPPVAPDGPAPPSAAAGAIAVTSAADPRVADFASIGDERRLAARGLFVAEGRFVVQRLIQARPELVRAVLVNQAALAALSGALAAVHAPVYVCEPRFFERLTGFNFHRGCLALAARPAPPDPLELARGARRLVVLDRVADPDNVGSVFRSALAFGVDAVWLGPGCADPLRRKAVRTSMGAALSVPFALFGAGAPPPEGAWPAPVGQLAQAGFELLALSPREPAEELSAQLAPPRGRHALLIGAEGDGLGAELEARASRRVCIRMQPGVDSLNLGVAAGIALHWVAQS